MSPHHEGRTVRVRDRHAQLSSRGAVRLGASSLFRPSTRHVTFEIVSGRNSRAVERSRADADTPQHRSSDASSSADSPPSSPMPHRLRQVRRIPSQTDHATSNGECSDPSQHTIGALLMRRAQTRHQRAWTRKRHDHAVRLKSAGCVHPSTQCLVCGLLFVAVLTTYLTLAFTMQLATALHVILVLSLLLCTILFFHGLLRTWLVRRRQVLHHSRNRRLPRSRHRRCRGSGYPEPLSPFDALPSDDSLYTPTTPLRVHLFRDEEAMIGEKDNSTVQDIYLDSPFADEDDAQRAMPTPPPPAYGLWRCSVRADPNLLHWSQGIRGEAELEGDAGTNDTVAVGGPGPKPPSYHGGDVEIEDVDSLEHPAFRSAASREPPLGLHPALQPALTGDVAVENNHNGDIVVPGEDWPLRNTSTTVQDVTRRMLLEDHRRHSMF